MRYVDPTGASNPTHPLAQFPTLRPVSDRQMGMAGRERKGQKGPRPWPTFGRSGIDARPEVGSRALIQINVAAECRDY